MAQFNEAIEIWALLKNHATSRGRSGENATQMEETVHVWPLILSGVWKASEDSEPQASRIYSSKASQKISI